MKKILFMFSLFALIASCNKEEAETGSGTVVVLDQTTVEEHVVGNWAGVINGPNGATENMEATVEGTTLGDKVGTGRYFAAGFSCGFEWTYERFSNGRVIFREKTLDPNICYDNLEILVRFENEDFNTLLVVIPVPNGTFEGALARQ